MPLRAESMCAIQQSWNQTHAPTLGFIHVRRVRRIQVAAEKSPSWSEAELAKLRQSSMLREPPANELEKIPFSFRYDYLCDSQDCRGHDMMCSDWEMAEAYRNFRRTYGGNWRPVFQQKFERMAEECDLHFFVGTVSDHPGRFIIIGLWYPPKEQQLLLS